MSDSKMTRREQRAHAQEFIDSLQGGSAFPNSERIWITGSRDDIRVPMRQITLSPTHTGGSKAHPLYGRMMRCRFMTPPAPMAIPPRRLMYIAGWQNCAPAGSKNAMTASPCHNAVQTILSSDWRMIA